MVTTRFTNITGRLVERYDVEDRNVNINGVASGRTQRNMTFNNTSMTNANTHKYIKYFDRQITTDPQDTWNSLGLGADGKGSNRTGAVDIAGYMQWLREHGYCFVGDACSKP